jgi:hypothetical protein
LYKAPKTLSFRSKIITNPKKPNSLERNVIYDTSKVVSKIQLDLPIWFKSSGFGQSDTMDFTFFEKKDDQSVSAKSMLLRIHAENTMPISFNLQGYFINENKVILDSLKGTSTEIIPSPDLDANGIIKATGKNFKDIQFDQDQISKLETTKKIVLKVTLKVGKNSNDYGKFLTSSSLKLSISCQGQAKITTN